MWWSGEGASGIQELFTGSYRSRSLRERRYSVTPSNIDEVAIAGSKHPSGVVRYRGTLHPGAAWRWCRRRRRRWRCCRGWCWCWRGAADSCKDIHPAPSIDVVWRARVAALRRRDKMSCVIHGCTTRGDLVFKAWNGRPQQRHGAGNVRSGHGRTAESAVSSYQKCCSRSECPFPAQ